LRLIRICLECSSCLSAAPIMLFLNAGIKHFLLTPVSNQTI
jgi:hypothetical protein